MVFSHVAVAWVALTGQIHIQEHSPNLTLFVYTFSLFVKTN